MQGLRTDIVPQPLEALAEKAPVREVACGLGHALFLLSTGRVCAWGNGGNGRLGLGDASDRAEACVITGKAPRYFFALMFPLII
jgi:alpha-tubulin suppressor-like RCC1 family protein